MVIPTLHLGPLNALVTSIEDSGMDPPRSSDLRPYALSCMSSGALTPFGSEAIVYLNGLSHPVGVVLVPRTLTKHKPGGHSGIHLPLVAFPQNLAQNLLHHRQPEFFTALGRSILVPGSILGRCYTALHLVGCLHSGRSLPHASPGVGGTCTAVWH